MQLYEANFAAVLPAFQKELNITEFISFDCEFTGLSANAKTDMDYLDTPIERYNKVKSAKFQLLQLGLTLWRRDTLSQWHPSSFTIHITPIVSNPNGPDRRFMCQASSLEFLFKCDTDIQRTLELGVPYLSHAEEGQWREKLKRNKDAINVARLNMTECEFISTTRIALKEFLAEEDQHCHLLKNVPISCRPLLERLIASEFPEQLSTRKAEYPANVEVIAYAGDPLLKYIGARRLIDMITASRVPMIGHNFYLDAIHMYRHFIGELPVDYEDFKAEFLAVFPLLLDTKLMAALPPLNQYISGNSLEELARICSQSPFTQLSLVDTMLSSDVKTAPSGSSREGLNNDIIDHGSSFTGSLATFYPKDCDAFHEAGFDSFITGKAFLAMTEKLRRLNKEGTSPKDVELNSLKAFYNKINFMKSIDLYFTSLTKSDILPVRSHFFSATTSSYVDLRKVFSIFGGTHISWTGNNRATICLHDKDQTQFVWKKYKSGALSGITLQAWKQHTSCPGSANSTPVGKRRRKASPQPESVTPVVTSAPVAEMEDGEVAPSTEEEEDAFPVPAWICKVSTSRNLSIFLHISILILAQCVLFMCAVRLISETFIRP